MPIVFIGIGGQGEYGKGIIDNIAHGHFPDFSKERGWTAEWKYNRKAMITKFAIGSGFCYWCGSTSVRMSRKEPLLQGGIFLSQADTKTRSCTGYPLIVFTQPLHFSITFCISLGNSVSKKISLPVPG